MDSVLVESSLKYLHIKLNILVVAASCLVGFVLVADFERWWPASEPPRVAVVDVRLGAPLYALIAAEREEVVLDLARRTLAPSWRLADAVEAAAAGPPPRVGRAGAWTCAAAREVVVCWRERRP